MYPRIPWELAADPKGSAEHTLGTADLNELIREVNFPFL
jgi:hypothetical protein